MAIQAMRDQEGRKITVGRKKLLEKLKENREKHAAEYKLAVAGYKEVALKKLSDAREKSRKELEKNLDIVRGKINDFSAETATEYRDFLMLVSAVQVELKVPRNYTDKYDAAIDMVDWDVNETLELSYSEFQCFVRDIWDWTDDFRFTNSAYLVR